MRILAALLLCVAAPATAAFAAEAKCNIPEETPVECKSETQQGLDQCYRDRFDHSEETLDEAYYTVMDRFQGQRDVLELAKEAWKVHRNGECLVSASKSATGSVYSTDLYQCKIRYNQAQKRRLEKDFLNCEEGEAPRPK